MGQISFSVPMIVQGDNPICWIACAAMVKSFKTGVMHPVSEFTGGFDPSSSCIPNPGGGAPSALDSILSGFGFTPDGANMSLDSSYIESTLRAHGPFFIFFFAANFPFTGASCLNMKGTPNDAHAVVINGVDTDAGTVGITNPWGTNTPPADIDVIISLMQAFSDKGLNCAYFLP